MTFKTGTAAIALGILLASGCQDRDFLHVQDEPRRNILPGDKPIPPQAPPESLYAHTSGQLYSIDSKSFAPVLIGNFHGAASQSVSLFDIAICLDGKLYGLTDDQILSINPRTAEVKPLPLRIPLDANGLTCLSDGRLVVSDSGVHLTNPAVTTIRTLTQNRRYQSSGDIIALPDGYLYEAATESSASDILVRIDPATGDTRRIGAIGFAGVFGLGYADGELYAFNQAGGIIRIHLRTGVGTLLRRTGLSFYGATTNPVFW